MPAIIKRYRRRDSDGIIWKGRPTLYPIDWKKELQLDREGVVREAPPCFELEHRSGICPLGLKHDVWCDPLENLVVDGLYAACGEHFIGTGTPSLRISHFAGGTGTGATTGGMTALVSEVYRDTWTEEDALTPTSFNFSMFLGPNAGNGFYFHEWGAFAGALMMARWLYSFEKDSTRTLNGDYVLSKA